MQTVRNCGVLRSAEAMFAMRCPYLFKRNHYGLVGIVFVSEVRSRRRRGGVQLL
jgi:hypothetical protein